MAIEIKYKHFKKGTTPEKKKTRKYQTPSSKIEVNSRFCWGGKNTFRSIFCMPLRPSTLTDLKSKKHNE